MPSPVQLREIHQCQPVDQKKKGERVKMTDAAKVKKERVGGDDDGGVGVCVWGGTHTWRLEPDNSQWWRVYTGGCGSV